jgi:hypothetical protein
MNGAQLLMAHGDSSGLMSEPPAYPVIIAVFLFMTTTDPKSKHADDPVLKLITSPIPKILWHYTDLEGFRGIVDSKKIHSTNVKYLNDKEEFNHALILAKQLLLEMLPLEDANPPLVRQLVADTFESIFSVGALCPANLSLFTASFTLHGDQLSQWRGYSRGSAGVSLGFDFSGARRFTAPVTTVTFAPCVYRDNDKEHLLHHLITFYLEPVLNLAKAFADMPTVLQSLDEMKKAQPNLNSEQIDKIYFDEIEERRKKELPQAVGEVSMKLLHLMALLKHSTFEEEQEWRYVIPVFANMHKSPQLKFRSRFRAF